jgi:signal transduction histidine kinase
VAHDLRNPLAPFQIALQVFRETFTPGPASDRVLDIMNRQMTHLLRLVDDLMDVSRIRHGKIELREEPVDVATLIAQGVETSWPLIESCHHALEVSLLPKPLLIEADPSFRPR